MSLRRACCNDRNMFVETPSSPEASGSSELLPTNKSLGRQRNELTLNPDLLVNLDKANLKVESNIMTSANKTSDI